jgi:hypothetical protein
MKLPWIKFYVNDWLSDEAVRSCSLEARGLWIDILALMSKSENHGHLLIGGRPATAEQLARIVGITPQKTTELMDELYASGVFSFSKDVIISRRMVKDERVRKSCSNRQIRFRNANVTQVSRSCNANVTEQRLETRDKRPDNTHTRAERPIRAEWIAYAKEIGWTGADVEGAFDYYESNGWKVGGKAPVKDWKACARNCHRRNQTKPMKGNQQPMKKIISQCESLPTYKVMGFATREAWVKAGCP